MSHRYRLYGADLLSPIPFVGLDRDSAADCASPVGEQAPPLCSITVSWEPVDKPRRLPDHEFTQSSGVADSGRTGGTIWLERHDDPSSSVLTFPGLLRAQLGPGDAVAIDPEAGVERASIEHLILDNVIPMALVRRGFTVLHGGAVQLPSGRCVAFIGASGAGKSTLVTSLNLAGLGLVTDDCVLISDPCGERQLALGHRRSRLLTSSIDLLEAASTGPVAALTQKQWVPAVAPIDHRSMRLDSIVVLLAPATVGQRPEHGQIRRLSAATGLVEMVRHSFHRPHDRATASQAFRELAGLAREIPAYEVLVGSGTAGLAGIAELLTNADRRSAGQSGFEIDVDDGSFSGGALGDDVIGSSPGAADQELVRR